MKDIAKRCGVSVATVSKALNGRQDIGEATKEKIEIAASRSPKFTAGAALKDAVK